MSKSSNFFRAFAIGLVAAAAAWVVGPAALGLVQITGMQIFGFATFAFSTVYSRFAAKDQAAANQRQGEITLKSAESPRVRIYGTARTGGTLVYWVTHGPEKRYISLVIVLADHECDGIEQIIFDDKTIGTLTETGYVQPGADWYLDNVEVVTEQPEVVSGVITLTRVPMAKATVALQNEFVDSYGPQASWTDLVEGEHYTHTAGSQTITFIAPAELVGATLPSRSVVVTYQVQLGSPLAQVRTYLGAAGQVADAQLITDSDGEWTANCKLSGQTYMIVTLQWHETKAAAGLPNNFSAIVRGCKVLDTRTDTIAWSPNWALCVRDYMSYAFKIPDADFVLDDVNDSAFSSEELVPVEEGSVWRYEVNGLLYSDRGRGDNLEEMLMAGAGSAVWSGGQWRILCGKYRLPISITLSDSDLAGPVQYRGALPRAETFNLVRGKYLDGRYVGGYPSGTRLFTRTNYTPYASAAYRLEDNDEEIARTVDLNMVIDYRVANRIAKQVMHRTRNGARMVAAWKLKALPIQVGDTVTVNLARYGVVDKVFEVVDRKFVFPSSIELTLIETAQAVYDWTYSEVANLDITPNTHLARATDVAELVLTVRASAVADVNGSATFDRMSDGTVVPYVLVSWPARLNAAETVQVRWKRTHELEYRTVDSRLGETSLRLELVSPDDVITIIGWAVNSIGARSQPFIVQTYTVPGDMPTPGVPPPIGSNLLTGASFSAGTDHIWTWTQATTNFAGVERLWWMADPVPPHAAALNIGIVGPSGEVVASESGSTQYAFAVFPKVRVHPSRRYCAFAALLPFQTDAQVYLSWHDATGLFLGEVRGNVVSSVGARSLAFTTHPPTDISLYGYSIAFGNPPANAIYGQFAWMAHGNWTADLGKTVFCIEPFLGEIDEGVMQRPLWSPDALPIVTRNLIQRGAATRVGVNQWLETTTPRYAPITYSGATALLSFALSDVDTETGDTIIWHINGQVSVPAGNRFRFSSSECATTDGLGAEVSYLDWMDLGPGDRQPFQLTGAFSQGTGATAYGSVGLFGCALAAGVVLHKIVIRVECIKR